MADNQLRIIGGRWRGRRVAFPDAQGLRPTPDRVRETLFNWLAPRIAGARCLDLFAGSGALGFEALSRGAAEVVFVERQRAVARVLQANLARLGAVADGRVVAGDALAYLAGPARAFDVVFLDPPFGLGLLTPTCAQLDARGWFAADARVYVESELPAPELPPAWTLLRDKRAGQVCYRLALPPSGGSP